MKVIFWAVVRFQPSSGTAGVQLLPPPPRGGHGLASPKFLPAEISGPSHQPPQVLKEMDAWDFQCVRGDYCRVWVSGENLSQRSGSGQQSVLFWTWHNFDFPNQGPTSTHPSPKLCPQYPPIPPIPTRLLSKAATHQSDPPERTRATLHAQPAHSVWSHATAAPGSADSFRPVGDTAAGPVSGRTAAHTTGSGVRTGATVLVVSRRRPRTARRWRSMTGPREGHGAVEWA